jgi:hypothetical protein
MKRLFCVLHALGAFVIGVVFIDTLHERFTFGYFTDLLFIFVMAIEFVRAVVNLINIEKEEKEKKLVK